ncbi:MAG TPA: hypothetical protein VKA15_12275, partial [Isosphaeraceae bacterium]|nr:hypothetical protein [Isosphaeraceae bacterium]
TVSPAPRVEGSRSHSVLDIATVGLGSVLRPLTSDDDLLGEMLEGRPGTGPGTVSDFVLGSYVLSSKPKTKSDHR